MNKRILIGIMLIGFFLFLSGCSFHGGTGVVPDKNLMESKNKNSSFIYGYIDMEEADTDLQYVKLLQVAPKKNAGSHWMRIHNGIFYLENVPPGSYQVVMFGGARFGFFCMSSIFCYRPYDNILPRSNKAMRLKIKKPGVFYMGSLKYVNIPGKIFVSSDSFELTELKSPSQKEVLKTIISFAEKSGWAKILKNFI